MASILLDPDRWRLALSGIPTEHSRAQLNRAFLEDATRKQWQTRQNKILRLALTTHQQDFILKEMLLRECSTEERQLLGNNRRALVSSLASATFQVLPQADTRAVQVLLRTVTGLEDSAKTNAHHPQRTIHPDISDDRLKKCCLYCFHKSCEN